MRVLLDTHILLWVRTAPDRLTVGERRVIDSAEVRFVSCVTLWELAILIALGRIGNDERLLEVPRGFGLLAVLPAHCKVLTRLPQHHRDPFDRMLIAQAKSERLPLLTRDWPMTRYNDHATILRLPEA